jgi:uncharacterized membrane protein (UPF0182 family)
MRNNDPFEDLMRSLEETLQRNNPLPQRTNPTGSGQGGEGVPPDDRPIDQPPQRRSWGWIIWVVLLAIIFLGSRIVSFLANWTWYESVGFEAVFWTRIWATLALFAGVAVIFLAIYLINLILARQMSPWGLAESPLLQLAQGFGLRVMPTLVWAGVALAAFLGLVASSQWEGFLRFLNQVPFEWRDPLFDRNVAFYVFTLPVWESVRGWLMVALSASFVAVLLVSGVVWNGPASSKRGMVHLAILGALMLGLMAWQYQIHALNLTMRQSGQFFGAGYADVRAELPATLMMIWLTIGAAVAVLISGFLKRGWVVAGATLVVWFVVGLVATSIYPMIVQRFQVGPNELALERTYIQDNITSTREAYALDEIDVQSYAARTTLTADRLIQQPDTLRNIRLWDYRPLLQTYNQIQALRQYYEFQDIDIDRYVIDGRRKQVMISARELVTERLSDDAQTWVNQRLVYTHGFGVAASPVAQVTQDGLPTFLLKDLPPTGVISVTVPQLYFGERLSDYVVGATAQAEFDYPREDGNATTRFSAESGIPMTWGNRILFALHMRDINLMLSRDISSESRLLWNRDIADRVLQVAPFLTFDRDPYIVIDDSGRLFWMHDAFTVSDRFPYSQPVGGINYIRNAVKVVTNAYDGTMTFYVADENDPIIATDLLDNIRYPEDLFRVQAETFRTYHMTDPEEFYNREDLWAWPEEIVEGSAVRVEPYYVLMQLPGSQDLDYIMIMPYTPSSRENMVAWMAVQNDPEKYGQKVVYNFGKDSLLFGPKQVEARIDQDPIISAQLTLWNQQGSNVIRGNMMVIPISESLLYVEPIYLQAASGRIPELQRVIVATADNVVMADNLGAALVSLFNLDPRSVDVLVELGAATLAGGSGGSAGGAAASTQVLTAAELIVRANDLFNEAQALLREGDFAGYGERVGQLEETLRDLARVENVEIPEVDETEAAPQTGDAPAPIDEALPAESVPAELPADEPVPAGALEEIP